MTSPLAGALPVSSAAWWDLTSLTVTVDLQWRYRHAWFCMVQGTLRACNELNERISPVRAANPKATWKELVAACNDQGVNLSVENLWMHSLNCLIVLLFHLLPITQCWREDGLSVFLQCLWSGLYWGGDWRPHWRAADSPSGHSLWLRRQVYINEDAHFFH